MTAYFVLGGAGFWDLTAGSARRGHRIRALVQRSMGPVWEANHVGLIFVLVVSWTAFPVPVGSAMSTLHLPARLLGAAFAVASVTRRSVSARPPAGSAPVAYRSAPRPARRWTRG
ncbi:MAG: cytochrome d ubiquinol oxidase subunit II [Solirubrobacteraceae bacterium]